MTRRIYTNLGIYAIVAVLILNLFPSFALADTALFEDSFEGYGIGALSYGSAQKWSDFNSRGFTQWTPSVAQDPTDPGNKVLAIDKNTASQDNKNEHLKTLNSAVGGNFEVSFRFYIPTNDGINASDSNSVAFSAIDSAHAATSLVDVTIYPGIGSLNSHGRVRNISKDEWHTVSLRVNTEAATRETYLDGENIYSSEVSSISGKFMGEFRVTVPGKQSEALVFIDDVTVKELPLSQYVSYEDILNGQENNSVTDNLNLNTQINDFSVRWESSLPQIISAEGTVTRPLLEDVHVTLTAHLKKTGEDSEFAERNFNVTVKAQTTLSDTVVFEDNFTSYSEGALPYGASQKWSDFSSRGFTQWTPKVVKDPADGNNKALAIDKNTASADNKNEHMKTLQSPVGGNFEVSFRFYVPTGDGINASIDNSITISSIDSAHAATSLVDVTIYPGSGSLKSYGQVRSVSKDEWHTLSMKVNAVSATRETYFDGERIYSSSVISSLSGKSMGEFRITVPGLQSKALIYIDDVTIKQIPIPEYIKYEDILNGQDKSSVTSALNLMTTHDIYSVEWESSLPSVISADGTVTPSPIKDTDVVLTATITRSTDNAALGTMKFTVTVPAPEYITYQDILNGQTKENVIYNLNLITQKDTFAIRWESSLPSVISTDGTVVRPLLEDAFVTLTAYIKNAGEDTAFATRTFSVTVQSKSELYDEEFNFEDDFALYNKGALPYGASQKWSDFSGRGFSQWIPTVATDPLNEVNQVLAIDKATSSADNLNQHFISNHEDITGRREVSFRFYVPSGMTTPGGKAYNAMSENAVTFALIDSEHAATFLIYTDLYVNSGGSPRVYSHGQSKMISFDSWNTLRMVLDPEKKIHSTYLNNELLYTDEFTAGNATSEFRIVVKGSLNETLVYVDDFKLVKLVISDDGAVVRAAESINLGDISSVSDNFVLPSVGDYDTMIEWTSMDSSVVELVGNLAVVKREIGKEKTVKLKAVTKRGNSQYEREFDVTLKPLGATEALVADFTFENIGGTQKPYYVTENLNLGNLYNGAISIEWRSSNSDVISKTGTVNRSKMDVPVSLTAEFTSGGESFEKTFDVVVAAQSEVLVNEDFSVQSSEGQNINGYNNWELEAPLGENGILATVEREVTDSVKEYDAAEKVLNLQRALTKDEGATNNQKLNKKFDKGIKREITAIDFDFMFTVDQGTLYTEINGMNRHYAITRTGFGLKGKTETIFGKTLDLNRWYHISVIQDAYRNTYDVYLDYEKVNAESIYAPGNSSINGISFYSNVKTAITHEGFRIRRITLRDFTHEAESAVDSAAEKLTIGEIDYGKAKIELPLYGEGNTQVSWESSNPDVISEKGVVTRQSTQKTVTLTATVKKGVYTRSKSFDVTVNATNGTESVTTEILQLIAQQLTEESITDENALRITKNLSLPSEITSGKAADIGGVDISWESNYPAIVSAEGIINRQPYGGAATLTATLKAKRNPQILVRKKLKFAVDTGGEVYFSYNFEDVTEKTAGEDITSWTTMLKRPAEANTEYGSQFYADKEPKDSLVGHEDANHALFLTRYTTSGYDTVSSMSHATVDNPLDGEYYYGDMLALSFKMKFLSSNDQLRMTVYCLKERNYYINPRSLTVSSNMLTHRYEEELELNKWHEFLFYYDTLSSRMDIYVNGEYILSEPIQYGEGAYNYFNQWRFFNDTIGTLIIDDIEVKKVAKQDDGEIVSDAISKVSIPSTITEDINLPTSIGNCSISWKSSDETVISDAGKINPGSAKNSSAILNATFRSGETMQTVAYCINVSSMGSYDKEYSITDIIIANNCVKGIKLKKTLSNNDDCTLMVLVYNQNSLSKVYSIDMEQMSQNETKEIVTDISLENMTNYKVKAFVWDRYETHEEPLSNIGYAIRKDAV